MNKPKIREFITDDYQAVVAILNVLCPDRPAVVENYIEFDEQIRADSRCERIRLLGEVDGRVIGLGQGSQPP